MKYQPAPPAVLLLADGTAFHGKAAGKIGTATGEIAFNTSMTGYQEIFTDPSYYGQILLMTPSHIGNYGTHEEEVESESLKIAGLVCKKFSDVYSRPAGTKTIGAYFEEQGMVGISDVDTRAIVRHIRSKGAMNAIISSDESDLKVLRERLAKIPDMDGLELSSKVTAKIAYEVGQTNASYRVALVDFGVKKNIIRCLNERECLVRVFPMTASLEEMLKWKPDGFMLSNGPGDPSAMEESITLIQKIVQTGTPVFGICLGHQLLALSVGLKTYKMHNGHRGANHPVKNLLTGSCEITSQNHGFVVDRKQAEARDDIEITHVHLNDQTLAGLRLKGKPVFSVQYHPESSAGPRDSRYLFDEFVALIRTNKTKS